MQIHTEAVQFKADGKLLSFVEKRVQKMETFFDKIIDANIILRLENSGQVRDKIAEVRMTVPGQTLFAKESHTTFEGSVDQAVEALRRQLIKYKQKVRS